MTDFQTYAREVLVASTLPVWLILVEGLVSWRRQEWPYRFSVTLGNIWCGIVVGLSRAFLALAAFASYAAVYEKWTPFAMNGNSAGALLYATLATTFVQYWFHRFSHEWRPLWAVHAVHHQSEDFNMTLALRESILQAPVGILLQLPLAFIGVPPAAFALITSITIAYSLALHSAHLGGLKRLGLLFASPSDHRVHHGINAGYLNKNYGTLLSIWDRIFHTYVPETEAPVFGTLIPFRDPNPLRANLAPVFEWLAPRANRAWRRTASGVGAAPGRTLKMYMLVNTALIIAVAVGASFLVLSHVVWAVALAAWGLASLHFLSESLSTNKIRPRAEAFRLGALIAASGVLTYGHLLAAPFTAGMALCAGIVLFWGAIGVFDSLNDQNSAETVVPVIF